MVVLSVDISKMTGSGELRRKMSSDWFLELIGLLFFGGKHSINTRNCGFENSSDADSTLITSCRSHSITLRPVRCRGMRLFIKKISSFRVLLFAIWLSKAAYTAALCISSNSAATMIEIQNLSENRRMNESIQSFSVQQHCNYTIIVFPS